MRWVTIVIVAGLIATGVVLDQRDRDVETYGGDVVQTGVPTAVDRSTTWYCPGGSATDGPAEVTVVITNTSDEERSVVVSALPGGRFPATGSTVTVDVAPGEAPELVLAALAEGAEWIGAVVEVDGTGVVVHQRVFGPAGRDRTTCLTRTAQRWMVADGSTRAVQEGEQHVILVLNPFPDDAVVNVTFTADVGGGSLDGVVVPAGSVTPIDVTAEVPEAAQVSTVLDVVAGRVVAGRLQVLGRGDSGEEQDIRLAAASASAPTWIVPTASRADGRIDVIGVTNPSEDEIAEVDLEIIPDDPTLAVDPIELNVRPGQTVLVDLSREERLGEIGALSVVVRSLRGVPVGVSIDTRAAVASSLTSGAAGGSGVDGASTAWLAATDGSVVEESMVVVVNPSLDLGTFAVVTVRGIDGEELASFELPAGERRALAVDAFADRRFVRVEADIPVVVASELVSANANSLIPAVALDAVVPLP